MAGSATPASGTAEIALHGSAERAELSWATEETQITVTLRCPPLGIEVAANDDRFDLALEAVIAQIPGGLVPLICGACRLGILDPFGASNGFDDLSCYRDWPALAEAIERQGRGAGAEAFAKLYRRRVTACDSCKRFRPRPLKPVL